MCEIACQVCIYDAGDGVMAESREMELLLEIGRLKNEYKELRLHLKQNNEQLSIMQVLPVDDRRAQNASTRTALRVELGKFTKAFARHLLPRLREQRVYEPAAWRASMQHLRMLATTDTSGMEDVAIETLAITFENLKSFP